ncbi:MAG: RNA methyltransferase [Candidatus Paceibacterota bacterium]|jgi:tRNA G18 (ribose-2'-O)-methylase SpoU
MILILHNIRSVYNVGAIFRTADAAGVSKIYLTGYTPSPLDRFGSIRKDITKTALGAEKSVSWEQHPSLSYAIAQLREECFNIVALEQAENSVDYKTFKSSGKTALIIGEERFGITQDILDQCDSIIEIPMKGKKESLNVSVATGIALFRILNI